MQLSFHFFLLFKLFIVALAASRPSDGFDADVIVVGGGISGLFAAHELQYYSNLSVLVNHPEFITANLFMRRNLC